ncbi:MAG TPA: RNA-binding cell elongation regulator Jag/EloR [Thermomicrobiales bacterium]|nr:RNA-binding cell elongation regulator Jag/EloR [Thermomicrobiales bacterium]HQZ89067.1 RNA-binding cell elongation regulator Jag/EloR [Thermomicrobiales bacterium]HRA32990.1 RNA-binding cell elongation regulator Jag/EloR [Thermomicrobiales bacterium]
MDRLRSVDIQARSADEAIRLALEQLGTTRDKVDVQILAETEDDIYGEGEVLVHVELKGSIAQSRGDRQPPHSAGPPRGSKPRVADGRPRDSRAPRQYSQNPRARGAAAPSAWRPPIDATPRQPSAATDEATIEAERLSKDIVRELLDRMGVHADVVAVDNPSVMPVSSDDPLTVFIDIMGRDLGMLIGRRGENLAHIQYMINLLVNKRTEDWIRVIVDIEGYRTHREESLIGLAERVARQVARNGRSIALEPMPASERRIVHMTLKELSDVRTESSGEGDNRRVTIYPS